ncbi:MAG: DNA-deoxyinosine glycosylase [Gammaproteobacteria bacterium]|nr:DNA-deoxyinosine glycosylase [Gammaproteobacteria bacterium]NNF50410.1 DNA-deoxyinosine glycosylase [Woeseiaceae bacterium]MBT8094413.1 DNA-deoxyinosine glycosylase [Gammaproteobacteria bacterium]MBT8104752.1 DNA-deoxyinosine glycosylase [Gammaproteobacteria bacterium]NNK24766.1 DNA-deoxyinosine glycosylase [Woeseiaceae bacterium]
MTARSTGFPPVARPDTRILILGSLPGERSIAEHRYYAHPQNAFWRIMQAIFGIDGEYADRCRQLAEHRVALWDVLYSSVRPGSMDADIRLSSAAPNDFGTFFEEHAQIRLIAFNGKKAERLFERFVDPLGVADSIRRVGLPSTSPAYASLSFSGKLVAWRDALLEQQ